MIAIYPLIIRWAGPDLCCGYVLHALHNPLARRVACFSNVTQTGRHETGCTIDGRCQPIQRLMAQQS